MPEMKLDSMELTQKNKAFSDIIEAAGNFLGMHLYNTLKGANIKEQYLICNC